MGLAGSVMGLRMWHEGLDSRVRGNDGFLVRAFHPFVTPAKAGVHGAAGSVAGFDVAARLTGFPRVRE